MVGTSFLPETREKIMSVVQKTVHLMIVKKKREIWRAWGPGTTFSSMPSRTYFFLLAPLPTTSNSVIKLGIHQQINPLIKSEPT
jgi:hypothetical protein